MTGSSQDRLLLVAAWVRGGIGGGHPADTAEERVVVRAAAFGTFGTRRAVEAALGRGPDAVRLVAWDVDR